MTKFPYVAPQTGRHAFNCPYCNAYASQDWDNYIRDGQYSGVTSSRCPHCQQLAIWMVDGMIYPKVTNAEFPHEELPEDCKADFEEAREIAAVSPRGAAAIQRLIIQKLMYHLGQPGKNINDDIKALVGGGLPVQIQQALDVCRVIGNNAVHPGTIDLDADPKIVNALFGLINFIVDDRIAKPKAVAALYATLPEGSLKAIEKRDKS